MNYTEYNRLVRKWQCRLISKASWQVYVSKFGTWEEVVKYLSKPKKSSKHRTGKFKVKEEELNEIEKLTKEWKKSNEQIGKKYGVCSRTIYRYKEYLWKIENK